MVVPFGIGVGDFIAVAKLAKDIVRELKKDSQAVSHYQHLVVELESLDSALSRINEIKPTQHKLIHLEAIRAATAACENPLQNFLRRLEKYGSTMSTWNAPEKRLEGVGDRVQYGFDIWGHVDDLRNILAGHIATINLLLLTQSLQVSSSVKILQMVWFVANETSLTTAENNRIEISSKVLQSTVLLQQVNRSQMGIGTDLELQGKALDTLQGTVDEAKFYCVQTHVALNSQAQAFRILQETVEQSKNITNQIQSKLNIEFDGNETPEIRRRAAAPDAEYLEVMRAIGNLNDVNVREMKEVNASNDKVELRAELECLKLKFEDAQTSSAAARSSSVLATTSKILNLVLSGIMAATAWTLMNQSQEIANLSRQLIENCTMPSGTLRSSSRMARKSTIYPQAALAFESRPCMVLGSLEETGGNKNSPENMLQEALKIPGTSASGKASTTFVVRIEALEPNADKISSSFSLQDLWDPPDGPGDFHIGKSAFFRWSDGSMEAISESDSEFLSLHHPSSESSVYNVASVITQRREQELLLVDFDAGRKIIFDADLGGKRKWRHLSFRNSPPLVPPPGAPSSSKQSFKKISNLRYAVICLEEHARRANSPLPDHIVPQLLPKRYRGNRFFSKTAGAGIVGSLPILIALAAFSAAREHLKDVLTKCIRPGKWVPHDYPCGRRELYRGMTVTIYYDLSNPDGSTKELLDGIQDGKDGPFYGPRPPSPEIQIRHQPLRKCLVGRSSTRIL